jgi:hypothetical protein
MLRTVAAGIVATFGVVGLPDVRRGGLVQRRGTGDHLTLPNRHGVHVPLFWVAGIVHSNGVNDMGARIKGSTSSQFLPMWAHTKQLSAGLPGNPPPIGSLLALRPPQSAGLARQLGLMES